MIIFDYLRRFQNKYNITEYSKKTFYNRLISRQSRRVTWNIRETKPSKNSRF